MAFTTEAGKLLCMSDADPRSRGRILFFNKPYGVLTRFSDNEGRPNLKSFIDVPGVYPVGRLDADSEGLLLLTDRGSLVEPLLAPGGKAKLYLACVEGQPREDALQRLRTGLVLKDGPTLPARARFVDEPPWLWDREPPIRFRKTVPTAWLELAISEGRNRQVRRMTAAVGLPTLRLVRIGFGPVLLGDLPSGCWREADPAERDALLALERSGQRVTRKAPVRPRARKNRRRPNA